MDYKNLLAGTVVAVLCSACSSTETVSEEQLDSNVQIAKAEAEDDGLVCKLEKRIGSNMRTKVCRTQEMIDKQREASKEGWTRLQRAGSTSNGG